MGESSQSEQRRLTPSQIVILAAGGVATVAVAASLAFAQGMAAVQQDEFDAVHERLERCERSIQSVAEVFQETTGRVQACEEQIGIEWEGTVPAPDNTPEPSSRSSAFHQL